MDAIRDICKVVADDEIAFLLERVEHIREEDDFGGLRAHLRAQFGRMNSPMKIDITFGDAITPREIVYPYPLLFEEGSVSIMAYTLETILAEKFEAIIKRGVTTTRARDFYDIAVLFDTFNQEIDWSKLALAIERTATRRRSLEIVKGYESICHELADSPDLQKLWSSYCRENRYAGTTGINYAVACLREIGDRTLPLIEP